MEKPRPVTFLLLQDKVGNHASLLETLSDSFANEVLVFNKDMSIIRYLSQEVKNLTAGNQFLPFIIVLCPSLDTETSSDMVDTIGTDDRELVRKTPVFAMNNHRPPGLKAFGHKTERDSDTTKPFDINSFQTWLDKLPFVKAEKISSGKQLLRINP